MALVKDSQIFDEEFTLSLHGDNSDYFTKLIAFAANVRGADTTIKERVEYFKEHVQEDAKRTVLEQRHSLVSAEDVRKCIIQKFAMVSEYLYPKKPYDAVKNFLTYDYKKLMEKSTVYYDSMREDIIRNNRYITNTNALEYMGYMMFQDTVDRIYSQAIERSDMTMLHKPMSFREHNINRNDLLLPVLNASRSLLTEADIISRFSIKSRQAILKEIVTLSDSFTNGWGANTCESILANYAFLSLIPGTTPEDLIIDDKMMYRISKD